MSKVVDRVEISHAHVFIWLYAISTIWHYTSSSHEVFYYWLHFDPIQTPAIICAVISAFIAACYPFSSRIFIVFITTQVIVNLTRIPFIPTHVVMELVLNVTILLSFLNLSVKQKSWNIDLNLMFGLFSPVGRWLLIIMYFFGTFHKINPGFMSPESSCAISYLNGLPIPDSLIQQDWMQYSAIYGTLILEFLAMILLLSSRTKYYGMLLGMPFHFLIGISSYGSLAHFSAFALTLHSLFAPANFGARIYNDRLIPEYLKSRNSLKIIATVIVLLQILFTILGNWFLMNALFGLFGLVLMILIFRHGKIDSSSNIPYRLISELKFVNIIPVIFFIHCCGPYIGLRTSGVVQMFSGLRTEGNVSNHYIITKPFYLFDYQKQIVYIIQSKDNFFEYLQQEKLGLLLYDFQNYLATKNTPVVLPMTVQLDGEIYNINDGNSLKLFVDKYFKPQNVIEKYYLSFRRVDDEKPSKCRH